MSDRLKIVILGLSLSSAWGNGHATTYRALVKGLADEGQDVLFLERDVPWYAGHRDLPSPDFCRLAFYESLDDLERFRSEIEAADAVIVGSYVPQGREVIDLVTGMSSNLLCFYDIDTPVTLTALENGEEEFLARRQIAGFDLYFSFTGGRVLKRLETDFGAKAAHPLHCSVDPSRYRDTGEEKTWDLGYLGTYSPDRQDKLETLLLQTARRCPKMRFVVGGARYPATVEWPANVDHIEHVPPDEHASFYSRQRFTLNLTRADMIMWGYSPSVRLFEAAACGTPIISDRWEGLEEFLPDGEALLTATSTEDMEVILTTISQSMRQAIAAQARRRILAAHTGHARAQELVGHLAATSAASAAPRLARLA